MSATPVICFGQQPCGFFPRRFFLAKVQTARRLQAELGGEIVYFCHDSDHDPRETQTLLHDRRTGELAALNFAFANKLQRKFSPLFLKRLPEGWRDHLARQLPAYVAPAAVDAFRTNPAATVADFCLEMYRRMGLLAGIRIVRSGDPAVRRAACPVDAFYVDVPHAGEIVRARHDAGRLRLHLGGEAFLDLPPAAFTAEQVSPARDTRWRWMQSVVHCTHYVAGASEQQYLDRSEAPEVTFVNRDPIDRSDEAYAEIPA